MPTYKNVSLSNKEFNGKVIEPGKEICSLAYYNENDIQLLKVSDKPYWNSTILSEKFTKDVDISVPSKDNLQKPVTKYSIHFCLQDGEVIIHYNSASNDPPLKLYPGCRWNIRTFDRAVDKILVRGVTDTFTLFVTIERLP